MRKHHYIRTLVFTALVFSLALPTQSQYVCGDADVSGDVNVADITYLVAYLFVGGPEPVPLLAADCDADGLVNVADLTYLVAYLFRGGPEPCSVPTGSLVDYTGCKSFQKDSIPPNLDCILYEYDGAGVLLLKHINAAFNCCPSSIDADITIEGGLITIDESESFDTLGPCYCLCLFDVDIEIVNLPHGQYTIMVNELYLQAGDDTLEFTISLTSSPDSGSYCVTRDHYPWGYWQTPPVDYSECKAFQKAAPSDSTPPNQSCIEYQYDGQNVLSFTHRNAGFNCCPDELAAAIHVEDNVITIEEIEYLYSGGCYCLCLFDLSYEVTGLPPGEYTVIVIEPYRHPDDAPLEFTIALSSSPSSGSYCVYRSHYPWGN
ncbi:MAG: dockerin type I repeat-containing protein [Candidatus Zixiibacteriota bacterium]